MFRLQKSGRLTLVDSTLVATTIYTMLVLDLQPWFFDRVEKILRNFFWAGSEEARGGQCKVLAWKAFVRLRNLAGSESRISACSILLGSGWNWWTGSGRGMGFKFSIPYDAEQLFLSAIDCRIGNGERLRFWLD